MCTIDSTNNFEITRQILSDMCVQRRLTACLHNYDRRVLDLQNMTKINVIFLILPIIYDIFGKNINVVKHALKKKYPRLHKTYTFVDACQEYDLALSFKNIYTLLVYCLQYSCSHSSEQKSVLARRIQEQFRTAMAIPTGITVDEWTATEIS